MFKYFEINRVLKFNFIVIISLLFIYPLFKEIFSSILVIILLINTVIYKKINNEKFNISIKNLIFTIPFWIIFFNCVLYSKSGFGPVTNALFFLIIPIIFFEIPKEFFLNFLSKLIPLLKITCLVIILCYVILFIKEKNSFYLFYESHNDSEFRRFVYEELKMFKIHPTYFTSILVLGVAHSMNNLKKNRKKIELIFIVPFIIITFFLLTKLNLVIMLAVIFYFILFKLKFSVSKKVFISCVILLSVLLSINYVPGLKSRFIELYNSYNTPPKGMSYDSTNVRTSIYTCSTELIKENWLWGTGFNNLQEKLNLCYKSNYQSAFYKNHNYLTHNYFSYIFISSGIIGGFLFLFYLYYIVKIALSKKDLLLNIFLINIFFMCCIEDFFYRHYGLLYFNLIYFSFLKYYDNFCKENA